MSVRFTCIALAVVCSFSPWARHPLVGTAQLLYHLTVNGVVSFSLLLLMAGYCPFYSLGGFQVGDITEVLLWLCTFLHMSLGGHLYLLGDILRSDLAAVVDVCALSHSVVSDSCNPMDCNPPGLSMGFSRQE